MVSQCGSDLSKLWFILSKKTRKQMTVIVVWEAILQNYFRLFGDDHWPLVHKVDIKGNWICMISFFNNWYGQQQWFAIGYSSKYKRPEVEPNDISDNGEIVEELTITGK